MSEYTIDIDEDLAEGGLTAYELYREEWDAYFKECDFRDDVRSVVYWYGHEAYEGGGTAIVKLSDGTFHELCLGHCSCYGPLDNQKYTYPDPESPCAVAARKRAVDEMYDGGEDE